MNKRRWSYRSRVILEPHELPIYSEQIPPIEDHSLNRRRR